MNIAIVGAGIGGLATAILLERLGHRISLFEQFRKPVPIGSGLMIQPVGLEVLKMAGVADAVLKVGADRTAGSRRRLWCRSGAWHSQGRAVFRAL